MQTSPFSGTPCAASVRYDPSNHEIILHAEIPNFSVRAPGHVFPMFLPRPECSAPILPLRSPIAIKAL
ncbi:hypothetical protein PoB_002752800 [Plakobranchus ocellatus]|uniref:Uncharacterized protein n=1 Tax=Plakobranchus ocellatus TaxID=259542 RepID=A0AAV4A2X5_9GAST|nr:hypothetical protein PoB_002752800 [Plakobranchus ocellatus]